MKTNKIKITFFDNKTKWIQVTTEKIKKAGNVNKYVLSKYSNVKTIESRRIGKFDKKYKYFELHYNYTFERWKDNRCRIEATNPEGHEDYTGYGERTDGRKNRFYIGQSTGWMPIYIEVLQTNSTGGSALYTTKGRTFKVI